MSIPQDLIFKGGKNIAMKVPTQEWKSTVAFYKDVLKLKVVEEGVTTSSNIPFVCFAFGNNNLWIDQVEHIKQAQIWLEIVTNDLEKAQSYFKETNIKRRDEAEPLPEGFKACWIENPSHIIHLLAER